VTVHTDAIHFLMQSNNQIFLVQTTVGFRTVPLIDFQPVRAIRSAEGVKRLLVAHRALHSESRRADIFRAEGIKFRNRSDGGQTPDYVTA
jgi:hypothetical protein